MHTPLIAASHTTAAHHNGHGNPVGQTSGIVLRNGLPMPILPQAQVSAQTRHLMIQTEAYFLAQHRGFQPDHALDDWLAAEELIGQVLAGQRSAC